MTSRKRSAFDTGSEFPIIRCLTTHALINSQEYYQTQDYSMGQGSAHGSAPVDDDGDSTVKEMSPVKAKKPPKRPSRAKKNDGKEKEAPKDWKKAEEIALCQAWCDVSENSEKGNVMKAKGFWEAVINYFERKRVQREGRNRAKAKKKSFASSREGSSSFVDLVADKYLGINLTKWEKMQEQQDSYIHLKNRELDIQEAARKEATDLKRKKLEIQRRKLRLAEKKKRDKDILFYNSVIDPSLPTIQQQKLQAIALYSASADDLDTTRCFLDFQ
ncbi:hypothetical protein Tco_0920859 [Tanacetum coccineum]